MGASCEPNADRRLQLVSSTEAILTVTSIQAECVSPIPSHITDLAHFRFRWFGLILLPFVSFSADGVNVILETWVAVVKYWCEPKESKGTTNASGDNDNISYMQSILSFNTNFEPTYCVQVLCHIMDYILKYIYIYINSKIMFIQIFDVYSYSQLHI